MRVLVVAIVMLGARFAAAESPATPADPPATDTQATDASKRSTSARSAQPTMSAEIDRAAPSDEPARRVHAPAPTPRGPTELDERAVHDAASDRAMGFSTALNLMPGNVDISLRSVLHHAGMLSAAIGVTRTVELSVQVIRVGTIGVAFGAGGKVALHRARTWAVAADANITVGESRYASASALISTCVDTGCVALFSGGVGIASVDEHGAQLFDSMDGMQLIGDASIVIGSSWARPLLEAAYFGSALGFAGVRFTSRHVAFDFGVGALRHTSNDSTDPGAVAALSVRP